MASSTTIRLEITPPSNIGAAAADGYRIYRGTLDPGVDPANRIYNTETDSSWTGFSDPETYEDSTVTIGDIVTYRVEIIRSSDASTKEFVFGPYLVPGAEDIGYPNNTPSNTDGFPYFIDTEPIVHLRADSELGVYGVNYSYTVSDPIKNHANSYSDFKPNGDRHQIKLWQKPDGTQTSVPLITLNSNYNSLNSGWIYNPNISGLASATDYYTSTTYNADLNWHPAHQVFSKVGIPHSNQTEILAARDTSIMLDEGVMTFSVSPARLDTSYSGSDWRYPDDWHGHEGFMMNMAPDGASVYNFSDGQSWVDPSPPFGIPYPSNPGFILTSTQSGYGGMGIGHVVQRSNNPNGRIARVGGGDWAYQHETFTRPLALPNHLHLIVTKQTGSGSASMWIDGNLIYHKDPLINTIGSTNTNVPQIWRDEAIRLGLLFLPMSGYPVFTASERSFQPMLFGNFCEKFAFSKVLPKSDFYRAVFYFQNKFRDHLAPQDGVYDKL